MRIEIVKLGLEFRPDQSQNKDLWLPMVTGGQRLIVSVVIDSILVKQNLHLVIYFLLSFSVVQI